MKRTIPVVCLAGLFLTGSAAAQNTKKFMFHLGGGFTEPVRYTDGPFKPGFNLVGGAGVNVHPNVGVMAEFGFNRLGFSDAALAASGAPGGSARIYSLTVNPIVRFNPAGRFDAYVVGGGGYYRRTIELTAPTVTTVTAFDPYYGFFYPAAVPGSVVLDSFSQNKGGLNIGGGISVRVRGDSNTKLFAETRYHYLYTNPTRTTLLPVTFGVRW